jgi:hypothetical protein
MRVLAGAGLMVLLATGAMACREAVSPPPSSDGTPAEAAQAVVDPPASTPASAGPAAASDTVFTGTVVETLNSGGYTYVRLSSGADEAWIAALEFDVKEGETISAALDMPMRNFQSRTLNRTFPLIYFVDRIGRNGEPLSPPAEGAPPSLMASHGAAPAPAAPAVAKLAPPAGGLSIADLFAKRTELSGKTVLVRGTVVKFNGAILDRNWFHIQDGSGEAASHDNDLTVTSGATVQVGDVVTVSGVLGTGRDFGAGYAYDAIVENATIER